VAEKKSPNPKPKAKPLDPMMAPATAKPQASAIGGPVADSTPREPRSNRHLAAIIIGVFVSLVLAVLIVFGVLIYGYRSDSTAVRAVSAVIPYPAMKVGGDYVSYHEYLFYLDANKKYLENQVTTNGQTPVDFTSSAGKTQLANLRAQVVNQLKDEVIVRQLARQNNVTISNSSLNDQYNQLIKSDGGVANIKKILALDYGWSLNDFKTVLKYQLLQAAVSTKITNNPTIDAQAKAEAEDVLKQIQAGGDFATLAKKYSQDSSAANGGDIGFISKGQTGDTALETAAFGQAAGQVSGVVKTQYGYVIVKTNEFNADKSQVHVSEILIKAVVFTDYLNQKVNATKSTIYIKTK
jgi:hypothetical protein